MMNAFELEEIRKRAQEATPGPWRWKLGPEDGMLPYLYSPEGLVMDFGDTTDFYPVEGTPPETDDSYFIAKAREDVPALIAEIDRLREGLDEIAYAFWSEDITQQEVVHEIHKMIIALVLETKGSETIDEG